MNKRDAKETRPLKKLSFQRETIRRLEAVSDEVLRQVAGGMKCPSEGTGAVC
jgi:hypothetical protein